MNLSKGLQRPGSTKFSLTITSAPISTLLLLLLVVVVVVVVVNVDVGAGVHISANFSDN